MTLPSLTIKSKLIIVLLTVAFLSILVIGYQGLHIGKNTLAERINAQLTSIRTNQKTHISSFFDNLRSELLSMASDPTVMTATKEFSSAYQRLQKAVLTNDQLDSLTAYYSNIFIPRLNENIEGNSDIDYLLPLQPAARYLQYYYIASNDNPLGQKANLDSAADRSYYSGVHAHYHPVFRNKVESFGYYDLFLIDFDSGNIIYSVAKETDFATSLNAGPYRTSAFAKLYASVRNSPNPGESQLVDFAFYRPSYGAPAAFVGATIFDEERQPIGILAIQISIDKINAILSNNGDWENAGLGETGEVILVGSDLKMRSNSRMFSTKADCDRNDKTCRLGTTVLLQSVDTPAAKAALSGESGIQLTPSYNGQGKTISAYEPLHAGQLQWAILANMDQDEAYAPIFNFQKALLTAAVILSSLITFGAMWIAYAFTRPVEKLIDGVHRLREGKEMQPITLNRHDEFGELADAFNHTVEVIQAQQQEISIQQHKNRELLLNILPEAVVNKLDETSLADGEPPHYAERVSNTTIMFSTLNGFTDYAESLDALQAIDELNELINNFDHAAERLGVEKIQTVGDSYMAASGITISRLDHSRRCMKFAREMLEIVRHFNHEKGIDLSIRIGIHTGQAFAGIVGKRHFVFDVWGDTVNIASRLRFDTVPNSILVTDAVFDRLGNQDDFHPVDDIASAAHGQLRVWCWQPEWAIDEDAETVMMDLPATSNHKTEA